MEQPARPARQWRWLTWVLLGLAIGLAGGFFWGSYAGACTGSAECSTRWDAVGAVGTWVGGLGTIAAVLVAVHAFQVEEHARRREEREAHVAMARGAAKDLEAAQGVTISGKISSWTDDVVTSVRVMVRNASSETQIFKVVLHIARLGRTFEMHRIDAGDTWHCSHEMFPGSGFPS